jgi:hypothetical protein
MGGWVGEWVSGLEGGRVGAGVGVGAGAGGWVGAGMGGWCQASGWMGGLGRHQVRGPRERAVTNCGGCRSREQGCLSTQARVKLLGFRIFRISPKNLKP